MGATRLFHYHSGSHDESTAKHSGKLSDLNWIVLLLYTLSVVKLRYRHVICALHGLSVMAGNQI